MTTIQTMTDLEAKTLAVYNINQSLYRISGDIALLKKLRDAEAAQVTLMASLVVAQEAMAIAQAKDNEAKQAELYSRFGKVTIVAIGSEQSNGSALGFSYRVTYEIKEYDGRTTNLITKQAMGFGSLPYGLYEYIINVMPHKLPTVLLSLASDAATAMAIYHRALAKGYIEA